MSAAHPFGTYLKQAFLNGYNYGILGLSCGLALIFQEPGWLLMGAGVELTYLYMLSTNPRFQRLVDSELGEQAKLDLRPLLARLWPYIDEPLRQRYNVLAQLAGRLEGEQITSTLKKNPFFQENQRKVAALLASFLRIAWAVTSYRQYLASVDQKDIEKNIERLIKEAESAPERIQAVKLKNIEVLKQRHAKVEKAKANVGYLDAQLETIEDTMKLVADQTITLSDPKGTGVQIDNLLTNLQETELIAAEMEAFDELEAGLDPSLLTREGE